MKTPLIEDERWFTHVEYFGVITRGRENDTHMHFVDVGVHHPFSRNVEVGGIVASGPHGGGMNLATNFGIGVRF